MNEHQHLEQQQQMLSPRVLGTQAPDVGEVQETISVSTTRVLTLIANLSSSDAGIRNAAVLEIFQGPPEQNKRVRAELSAEQYHRAWQVYFRLSPGRE